MVSFVLGGYITRVIALPYYIILGLAKFGYFFWVVVINSLHSHPVPFASLLKTGGAAETLSRNLAKSASLHSSTSAFANPLFSFYYGAAQLDTIAQGRSSLPLH